MYSDHHHVTSVTTVYAGNSLHNALENLLLDGGSLYSSIAVVPDPDNRPAPACALHDVYHAPPAQPTPPVATKSPVAPPKSRLPRHQEQKVLQRQRRLRNVHDDVSFRGLRAEGNRNGKGRGGASSKEGKNGAGVKGGEDHGPPWCGTHDRILGFISCADIARKVSEDRALLGDGLADVTMGELYNAGRISAAATIQEDHTVLQALYQM